jgi:hypothetical protein
MKTSVCTAIVLFLGAVSFTFSYEIILKNGKEFEGTLISEDTEKITIKDKDGLILNFKKGIVDLEKTSEANKPVEEPPVETKQPDKPVEQTPAKPRKPARVYDQSDVYRLRSEYPMESGAGVQFEEGSPDHAPKGKSGEEWQAITQSLLDEIKAAEQAYEQSAAKCKEFQGATIQTHIAVTSEGKQTDLAEASKRACQVAEEAKAAVEAARAQHAAAVEQARQENVLPGYIVTE